MLDALWPVLFASFLWWFSTGVLIYLNGLPQKTFRWSLLGATLLMAGGIYGLSVSASDASTSGVYTAFASVLMIWAWLEITFYMGVVTGPRRVACAPGCKGIAHFGHALAASLWHEIAIVVAAVIVAWNCAGAANQVALWTFLTLWGMHESARLNVFLGVPNRAEQFLPAHLSYLKSFFRDRPLNMLFPVSVTVGTGGLALVVQAAMGHPSGSGAATGLILVATLLGLAILEHWFLVIPLDGAKLWEWSLASRGGSHHTHTHSGTHAGDAARAHALHDAVALVPAENSNVTPLRRTAHGSGLPDISIANRRPL